MTLLSMSPSTARSASLSFANQTIGKLSATRVSARSFCSAPGRARRFTGLCSHRRPRTAKEPSVSGNTSYDVNRFTNLDREMERLRSQALQTWPKEVRMLDWYGLRDGMSVLELG